jgi:ERCC4-type nuclease
MSSDDDGSVAAPDLRAFIVVCSNEQAHAQTHQNINLAQLIEAASGYETAVRPLACGDYAIVLARDRTEAKTDAAKVLVLLERKRLDDLLASIRAKDKRYESQQQRLMATGVPRIMWVMCQAPPTFQPDAAALRSMNSAMVHLSCHKNTSVTTLQSRSPDEFGRWLGSLAKYAPLSIGCHRAVSVDIVQKAGVKRKVQTPDEAMQQMLCCIDRVSLQVAKAITARWPTMRALLDGWLHVALETRNKRIAHLDSVFAAVAAAAPKKGSAKRRPASDAALDPVAAAGDMLASIKVGDKGRAVGPKLSKEIRLFLYPELERVVAEQ